MLQQPLGYYHEYKQGRRITVDAGLRYQAAEKLGLMVQLNALARARDSGAQAEPDDTGGRSLFLSPGASYALSPDVQVYAFVQLPLYQYVNGVQLTARRAFALGISSHF
jgi:hypothetical protein